MSINKLIDAENIDDVRFCKDGFYFWSSQGNSYGPYVSQEQARLARSLFLFCLEGDETKPLPLTDEQFKVFSTPTDQEQIKKVI